MSGIGYNEQARDFMSRKLEKYEDIRDKGIDALIEDLAGDGRNITVS